MINGISRRQAGVGLASIGLTGLGWPGIVHADKATEDAARKEGTLTWYVAQVDAEKAEAMGRAFTESHPGIKVSVIRTTGQVAYQRLQLDIKNRTPQCDVFSATDYSHMPTLKDQKQITPYTAENAEGLLPDFKRLSDPGYFYVTNANRYFLIYNTNKVKPEDAPKAWTDLLDPKWKGKVATGHPGFSGCTGTWALGIKKVYGWDFFEKLALNKPRIGRSAVDPVTLISAGECQVGLASANNAYTNVARGNPIAINHPTDGVVLCVTPSAIPLNAPHPAAARLFMEWMLSDQFSRLVASDGSEPIRVGVPALAGMPKLADVKIIPLTPDEIRNGVPTVIEQWRETFG